METIDTVERRRRLVVRQHVGVPAASIEEAVSDLVVLHATDPASIYLQLCARVPDISLEDVQTEMYEQRSLTKVMAMRRTLFVARTEDASAVAASSAPKIWAQERKRIIKALSDRFDDPETRLKSWEDLAEETIREHGESSTTEIKNLAPELAESFVLGAHTKFPSKVSVASRILILLASEGRAVRARPLGGWLGTQYRWALPDNWSPSFVEPIDEEVASVWLVERWLNRFGPGSLTDLVWWTGWTKTKTRKVLSTLDVAEVDLGSEDRGLIMRDDIDSAPIEMPQPAVALLPSLDATVMGWKHRDWYMKPEMVPELVDSNGNVGPTIWVDGEVVGAWGVAPSDKVTLAPQMPLDTATLDRLHLEASRLDEWMGGRPFNWVFDTPLHREIARGATP